MEAVFCGLGGARLFCEPLLRLLGLENTERKQAVSIMHRTSLVKQLNQDWSKAVSELSGRLNCTLRPLACVLPLGPQFVD